MTYDGSSSETINIVWAIGDNALYKINRLTGQTTLVAPLSGSPRLDQVTAMALIPSGSSQAFITDTTETDLFSLNLQTAQVLWKGSIGETANPFLDLSAYGGSLLGVRANGGMYVINVTTSVQTLLYPGNYTAVEYLQRGSPFCYANCDQTTTNPVLTPNDFQCFLDKFVAHDSYANCDGVGGLTGGDFQCFLDQYVSGCP